MDIPKSVIGRFQLEDGTIIELPVHISVDEHYLAKQTVATITLQAVFMDATADFSDKIVHVIPSHDLGNKLEPTVRFNCIATFHIKEPSEKV